MAAVLCAILVWEDTGTFEGFADTGRTVAYFDMADVRKPTSSNAGIIAGDGALKNTVFKAAKGDIVWPEEGQMVTIGGVSYQYGGDHTEEILSLGNAPAENQAYQAGGGYVLWRKADREIVLHEASITADYVALELPAGARVILEGENTLRSENSYALYAGNGDISVSGTGALTAEGWPGSTALPWGYAVCADTGSVKVDIDGSLSLLAGGINAQAGSISVKAGSIDIAGLVRAGSAVLAEASGSLSIENPLNMAVMSVNGGDVTLVSTGGDITVKGGNGYNSYGIQGNGGAVILDAAGTVSAEGYNGYAGVNAGSLALSGTIAEGERLHSTCAVTVPAGKTLYNEGTLFINSGGVSVAGTLVSGQQGMISNANGSITPTVTGNGTVTTGPERVSSLDFRFNTPTEEKEYDVISGGTARWEPGGNGQANRLTLTGAVLSGERYVVAVPQNTEIVLEGECSITAAGGNALYAKGGILKVTGTGSLSVCMPDSSDMNAVLYGETGIDIEIGGSVSVTGQSAVTAVRAGGGPLSIKSKGDIAVDGGMFGNNITLEAEGTVSVTNAEGAGIYASESKTVSVKAKGGDLTLKGTGHCAVYAASEPQILLSASGNLFVSGSSELGFSSLYGGDLSLAGTIPEGTEIDTFRNVTIPDGETLINNGTLRLFGMNGSVSVWGILENNGAIVNGSGSVTPEIKGNGSIVEECGLDFTAVDTPFEGNGYQWDEAEKTLTLTDFDMDIIPAGPALILPADSKLVVNGVNMLHSGAGTVIRAKGDLEISGSGILNGSTAGSVVLDAHGSVTITDITLTLTTEEEKPDLGTIVILTNGNDLMIDGTADVTLTIANYAATGVGFGICTSTPQSGASSDAGAVKIGSEAVLSVSAPVGLLVKSPAGQQTEVAILGAFEADCGGDGLAANLLGVILNLTGSSIHMSEGAHIWLSEKTHTLTGEAEITDFTGGFLAVACGNDTEVDYYKVTADGKNGLYREGSTVSFTAAPEDKPNFSRWQADGVMLAAPADRTIVFTMPSNEVTLDSLERFTVTAEALPKAGGSVTGGGSYEENETAVMEADAAAGYRFVKWMEGENEAGREAVLHFTVKADRALTAVFEETEDPTDPENPTGPPDPENPTGPTDPENPTNPTDPSDPANPTDPTDPENPTSPAGSTDPTNPTEPAKPENPGKPTDPENPIKPGDPENPAAEYTIYVSAEPESGGSVNGGGVYRKNETAVVRAAAADGYCFVRWLEGENEVSRETAYGFPVTGDRTLTAVFERKGGISGSDSETEDGDSADNSGGTGSLGKGDTASGRWVADQIGRRYRLTNGNYIAGHMGKDSQGNDVEYVVWEKIEGAWWAFGADGYRKAGWVLDAASGLWYYIDEEKGMKTVWHLDLQDGCWYYLDTVSGQMLTGWQRIDGHWYYFSPASAAQTWFYDRGSGKWNYDGSKGQRPLGAMYQNENTPDRYFVREDGSWDGKTPSRE